MIENFYEELDNKYNMLAVNNNKKEVIELIKALESKLGDRVFFICYSGNEIIDNNLFSIIRGLLEKLGKMENLYVLINSPGGDPHSAYRIVNYFYNHTKNLYVLVVNYAKSAATVFCLGAKKIYMGKTAELGPIDILIVDPKDNTNLISILDSFRTVDYLREYTVNTINYIVNFLTNKDNFGMDKYIALSESEKFVKDIITPLYEQINPLELGSFNRKLNLALEYGIKIMKRHSDLNFENIFRTVWKLTWGYPAHDFVIDLEEAKEIGLPVLEMDTKIEDICLNIYHKSKGCLGYYDKTDDIDEVKKDVEKK